VTFLGLVTPPSTFVRPRGLSSSARPSPSLQTKEDHFHALGSSSETHPAAAASEPMTADSLRKTSRHRAKAAPPLVFSPVQRSRCDESARPACASDEVPPPSVPSPPGVSHALRGLLLIDRAPVFQAADARRFHSPSELCSSWKLSRLVTESCPPRRFPSAPPYRCRSCLIAVVASPRGCLFQKAGFRTPSICRTSAEPCSLGRFGPSWCSRSRSRVSPPFRPWSSSASPSLRSPMRPDLRRLPTEPVALPAVASADHRGVLGLLRTHRRSE